MEKINLILLIGQILILIGLLYILFKEKKSFKSSLTNEINTVVPYSGLSQDQATKDAEKDISDLDMIDEIVFESPEGEKIKFKKITEDLNINNYEKVLVGNTEFLTSSALSGIAQVGIISALTPNGIYTATASPHLLAKFTDGTFSTMIHSESGKIIRHAGFQSAFSSVFAPIVTFQLLSFITGQYYLHGISKQLEAINRGIDKLLKYQKASWQGDIYAVARIISRLIALKHPNIEDLIVLKNCEEKITSLFESHLLLLKRIEFIEMPSSFFTIDKVAEIREKLERSDFNFHFSMVINCEKMLYFIKFVELFLNIKLCKYDKNRIDKVKELIEEIETWDKHKTFSLGEGKQHLEIFYNDLMEKLDKVFNDAWINKDKVLELKEEYKKYKSMFIEELNSKGELIERAKEMIRKLHEPQQILLQLEDGNLYILHPQKIP